MTGLTTWTNRRSRNGTQSHKFIKLVVIAEYVVKKRIKK